MSGSLEELGKTSNKSDSLCTSSCMGLRVGKLSVETLGMSSRHIAICAARFALGGRYMKPGLLASAHRKRRDAGGGDANLIVFLDGGRISEATWIGSLCTCMCVLASMDHESPAPISPYGLAW